MRVRLGIAWLTSQLLLTLGCCCAAEPPLPVLRSAHSVQALSPAEAARGYRVHLDRAQITFLQSGSGTVFLLDKTDAIRAEVPDANVLGLTSADVVTVDGATAPGDAGPLIVQARIRKIDHASLPAAAQVSVDLVTAGLYDAHWVSVEGIVRSAAVSGEPNAGRSAELRLTLAAGQDEVEVSAPVSSSVNPARLVDAEVRLRAVAENQFNQRRLLVATHLHMPDLSYLQVVHAPADAFALPLVRIADIRLAGTGNPGHRIRTRGVITSTWGELNFSINDAGHGMFVTCEQPAALHVGDLVEAVGFPSLGDYSLYLEHTVIRRIGSAPQPPPVRLTAAQAFTGGYDANPIELQGRVLERYPEPNDGLTLLLSDAGTSFLAVLPPGGHAANLRSIGVGSLVRVTGICVIHADESHNPRELDILLRSPDDLVALQQPSWWTPRHTLTLAAVLAAVAFVVLVWNGLLRRRVHAQTRQIRAQLEESGRLRALAEAANQEKSRALEDLLAAQKDLLAAQEKLQFQATHDPLTGLWNRAALLENLHRELARSLRTGAPLGVLLLDLDHFKQVNDTHGHLAGDAVLQEIGLRLMRATRPYDIAGRYGGEEFLVILPGCGWEETEHSAERIRSTVRSVPFRAGGTEFFLTVSIGATVASLGSESEPVLLHQADVALYQAKSEGRDRTVIYCARATQTEQVP